MTTRFTIIAALVVIAGLQPMVAQQSRAHAEKLLAAAQHKATVDGDLQAAIKQYSAIAETFKNDHAVAAAALVRLAECYDKLGDTRARSTYERVLREYSDQKDLAAEARGRVAVLDDAARGRNAMATKADVLAIRQMWTHMDFGASADGTVSADGRYLAFVDWTEEGDVAVLDQETGAHHRLTKSGSEEWTEVAPAISRDGRQIAYQWDFGRGRLELRLIARNGGEPTIVYRNEDVTYLEPFDWSPDGTQVVAAFERADHTNQIVLVSVPSGSVRVLKSLEWRWPRKMVFSPDGRYVAYDAEVTQGAPERDVFVIATDGSQEAAIVAHPANDFLLGWFPDAGRVLFGSDRRGTNGAWMIPVADGKPSGEPELLKADIGRDATGIGFKGSNSFVYGVNTSQVDVYFATWDPATGSIIEGPAPIVARLQQQRRNAMWSPNGQEVAYTAQSSLGTFRLVINIYTVRTGQIREVPMKLSYVNTPICWFPDGQALIVGGTDLRGRSGLFKIDVSTGEIDGDPIATDTVFGYAAVSPDSKKIYYYLRGRQARENSAIVARDLVSGREENVVNADRSFAMSPDGQWLAFASGASIKMIPTSGGESRTLVASIPDSQGDLPHYFPIRWSGDGNNLFYVLKGEVWRVRIAERTQERVNLQGLKPVGWVSSHPNGRHLAVTGGAQKSEVWVMDNLAAKLSGSR